MPIYEYLCPNCKNKMEVFVREERKNNEYKCPNCNSPVKRILSPVYSNFSSWKESLDAKGKWAATPED